MKYAVIYTRVSTIEQVQTGISLEVQLEITQRYAAFKNLEVISVISDEGVSGSIPLHDRPGGRRLLELVLDPKVSVVIAYKLDRVFRDTADCLITTKQWDLADVDLHLVDIGGQPVDTSTAMGRFFLTIMAGVAEMERNLIIERTRAAMTHLKENNRLAGSLPYGSYVAEDGTSLLPNPKEQKVIKAVKRLHKKGLSLRKIAEYLDDKGLQSRAGTTFYASQIKRILERN
ncbi:MAG: recombinase family protein [Gammaproteobacteria bacterium]|nr:recombinase family protein [Gammaproteobacteria bacterium]